LLIENYQEAAPSSDGKQSNQGGGEAACAKLCIVPFIAALFFRIIAACGKNLQSQNYTYKL